MNQFMKLTRKPILIYYGDFIPKEKTTTYSQNFWREVLISAKEWAKLVNENGGDVTVIHLPDIGINGNTHFIMSDLNNIEIADHIQKWLKEKKLN